MARSLFVSRTKETIALPFDPPQTATIRALTGHEHDEAQNAHRKEIASGTGRGWASTFLRKMAEGTATTADALKVLHDPLSGFDRYTIVKAGVVEWSYDLPVDDAAFAEMSEEGVEFLALAILQRTRPELFATSAAEVEAVVKNG